MLTVPSLLDRLRATFAPDAPQTFSQMYNLVESVNVLVLDDLGAQSSTPWATEKLFQLLNERHMRELPTVITTNLPLWEFEPRLQSRLGDRHLVNQVHINAPDYRVWSSDPGGETWSDLNSLDLHQGETSIPMMCSGLVAPTRTSWWEFIKHWNCGWSSHRVGWCWPVLPAAARPIWRPHWPTGGAIQVAMFCLPRSRT